MTPTGAARYQSVILPSLIENGRAGVQAPGLCQSIAYMKIVKKFSQSDLEKNLQKKHSNLY